MARSARRWRRRRRCSRRPALERRLRAAPVRYLDGTRLRRAAAAAARWVSQRQENLNGINVFPVPDGDTGTNLAATLVSAAERAQRVRERGVGAVSRAL